MPRHLKRILIWKGYLLLWLLAFISVFWFCLVVALQFLGSRPQTLYTLADMAGVQLSIGQFSARTRPMASAIDVMLDQVHLVWEGGQLDIGHLEGDLSLLNLISPDLAVGRQMQIQRMTLMLATDAQTASTTNPMANPWLRLWEETDIEEGALIWQADSPWMIDQIHISLSHQAHWQANFSGQMHYPSVPTFPIVAQATIHHQFGFNPKVAFEASAAPEDLMVLGQHYNFKFSLHGDWNAESLQSDVCLDALTQDASGQPLIQQVLGHVRSDDLLLWDFTVHQLRVGQDVLDLPVWPRLTVHPQSGAVLALNQVHLTAQDRWLHAMPEAVQRFWYEWQPELWLNQLSLHWGNDGALDAIRGGVDLLRWSPTDTMPGVALRQLTFDYHPQDGRLEVIPLGERKMEWELASGQHFPVTASPLVLRLTPDHPFTDWTLPSWDVQIGAVNVSVLADVHANQPTQIQVDVKSQKLADILPLLPMKQFSLPLQDWLNMALQDGKNIHAKAHFHGALAQLLSGDVNDHNLALSATAQDVRLLFDRQYPALTQADAQLYWQDRRLIIQTPRALISNARVEQVKAEVLFLANEQIALRVNGQLAADLSQAQSFLLASPLASELNLVDPLKRVNLSGAATGQLSLWFPLDGFTGHNALPRVRGVVKLKDATLHDRSLTLTNIAGHLLFSEQGVDFPNAQGMWQGGRLQGRVYSKEKSDLVVKLQSATPIHTQGIAQGIVDWRADALIKQNGSVDLRLDGDQKRLDVLLPQPFTKKQGQERSWQLHITGKEDRFVAQWLDRQWRGEVELTMNQSTPHIQRLSWLPLAVKRHEPVVVQLPTLPLDAWLDWLDQQPEVRSGLTLPSEGVLSADSVTFADQTFEDVDVRWHQTNEGGSVDLQSEAISGSVNWTAQSAHVSLDHLRWRRSVKLPSEKLIAPLPTCRSPSASPWRTTNIHIHQLSLETDRQGVKTKTPLTQLRGQFKQEGSVRRLESLQFQSASVHAQGDWVWDTRDNQSTIALHARAEKAEDMVRLWGLDQVVSGGSSDLDAQIHWLGGLDCLDTRLLTGHVHLRADEGALSETSPGLARLFGLLSFDAFTRRLKIGLNDVVNQGLAYDKVEATAQLSRGLFQLDSLQLDGPSVRIRLSGNTDLIAEEHALEAQVIPLVGDSIPTMALLSGVSPITAIGVYLLQKIVPPLDGNLFTFHYHITGSWQDPILTEVRDVE